MRESTHISRERENKRVAYISIVMSTTATTTTTPASPVSEEPTLLETPETTTTLSPRPQIPCSENALSFPAVTDNHDPVSIPYDETSVKDPDPRSKEEPTTAITNTAIDMVRPSSSPSFPFVQEDNDDKNNDHDEENQPPGQPSPPMPLPEQPLPRAAAKRNNGDDADTVQLEDGGRRREFRLTVTSNLLFIIAACLYLVLAIYDVQWTTSIRGIPTSVLQAEDDVAWTDYEDVLAELGDDYVFQTPRSDVWVSKYIMVYFCASTTFMILGIVEYIQFHMRIVGVFFMLAGFFGVLSALYVEKNDDLSNSFNLVSCVLFSLEAIDIFVHRPRADMKLWFRAADACFLCGAVLELITAFVGKFAETYTVGLAATDIVSCCLWIICALIYSYTTARLYQKGAFQFDNDNYNKNNNQDDKRETSHKTRFLVKTTMPIDDEMDIEAASTKEGSGDSSDDGTTGDA